jgi:hypothetical protein
MAKVAKVEEYDEKPWGFANPRRGQRYHELALAFIKDHPIGTTLTVDEFDTWAQHRGELNVPVGAPKTSDAWKAHLQRRHELRNKLRTASTHSRMLESGSTPFSLDQVSQGALEVRKPQDAIIQGNIPKKIASLITTKRKQLAFVMQSADWEHIPPHLRERLESIYDDIDLFKESIDMHERQLSMKFAKVQSKIRRELEAGAITPVNHGLQQLLSDQSDESHASEDQH